MVTLSIENSAQMTWCMHLYAIIILRLHYENRIEMSLFEWHKLTQ